MMGTWTPSSSLPSLFVQVGYNKACGLVEMGDYAAAELELKLAIKLGVCYVCGLLLESLSLEHAPAQGNH